MSEEVPYDQEVGRKEKGLFSILLLISVALLFIHPLYPLLFLGLLGFTLFLVFSLMFLVYLVNYKEDISY